MTFIDTSSASTATAFSSQRKVDRCQNGVLWATFWNGQYSTTHAFEFWYSLDNGATWAENTGGRLGFGSTTAAATPNASLFIDVDDFAHLVYKDAAYGHIIYRRGVANTARTAWTWSAATTITTSEDFNYPDVIAVRNTSTNGWDAFVVASYVSSINSNTYVGFSRVPIGLDGTIGARKHDGLTNLHTGFGALAGNYSTNVHTWPSIDFNHTGDGKTGTPHLYVAWSAGGTGAGLGIRFRKATYSGGSWTWGNEAEIDPDHYVNQTSKWLNCLFDGTRILIGGFIEGPTRLRLLERDAADTTTTSRVAYAPATVDEYMQYGSLTYDQDANVYFFANWSGATTGSRPVKYRIWTRTGSSLGGEVVVDPNGPGGSTTVAAAKRGHSNNRIEFIYLTGSASPYNVSYDAITLNTPPNAPVLVNPGSGQTIDLSATNRFDWDFSDPDSGDTQAQYQIQIRPAGSTVNAVDVTNETPNTYHDVAGGTLTAGDYEWRVRTWDAAGEVGPYSAWEPFTAASPPDTPTITDPTSGQTIGTEDYTVQWSAVSQDAYQLRRIADSAGTPDSLTVYFDTGQVNSSGARSRTVTFETNNRYEWVQVRVLRSGLWSGWAQVRVQVSYTPPAVPTVTLTAADVDGSIFVAVNHPTPATGEPQVTSHDVHRRVQIQGGDGIRVARQVQPDVTWRDWAVASGVEYEYRVRARGDNGTSTWSVWVGAADIQAGTYGGGY